MGKPNNIYSSHKAPKADARLLFNGAFLSGGSGSDSPQLIQIVFREYIVPDSSIFGVVGLLLNVSILSLCQKQFLFGLRA